MILRHRRGDYDLAGSGEMVRAMAAHHLNSERFQIARGAGIGVATRNRDASPREQLGERTHPCAGDPHEMDRATVGGVKKRH